MSAAKLQSQRLYFVPFSHHHCPFMREYLSDPERTRFRPLEKPYPEEKVREWVKKRLIHWQKHRFGSFIVHRKDSGQKIGFCGLEYVGNSDFIDIRYGLVQSAWGQGYAFEAAQLCLKFGFEVLGLEQIYGAAVPENHASIQILKKLGMQPDSSCDLYGDKVEPYSLKCPAHVNGSRSSLHQFEKY